MSAPLEHVIEAQVGPVATAANDLSTDIGEAPYSGTVSDVGYVPSAAITGAATNNRTVQLVNRGQSGSGSTVVASLTFASGVNAAAHDEVALTLSTTAGATGVVDGDVLEWQSVHVGTGIADPGGLARVTVDRT